MHYSPRIESAIRFAAKRHDGHVRVERERLPYVTHVFSVAVMVSNFTDSEDAVIAALLHDTLEDTQATADDIEKLFGLHVRQVVESVTEPKLPVWKERKLGYLAQLEAAPLDALYVAAADKIHNIESKLALFEHEGIGSQKKWSNPPSEYVWYHGSVVDIISRRLPGALAEKLAHVFAKEKELTERSS